MRGRGILEKGLKTGPETGWGRAPGAGWIGLYRCGWGGRRRDGRVMTASADGPRVNGAFVHEALLYGGAEEYLAGTLPFLRGGLAAGEPLLVAVPGPNLELIRNSLRSEEHTSELQSLAYLVCRLL